MHWRVFTMFTLLFCLQEKVMFGQFCLPDVYAREFEGDLAAYYSNSIRVVQPASLQDVPFIFEHENGNISLLSSYSDSTNSTKLPYVRSGLHLEVNEYGVIQHATGITHEQPGLLLIDALYEPEQNRFILLTEDGEFSRISAYKPGGSSEWSHTLSGINDSYTWNNTNSTASSIRITQPGTYSLEVRNKCGMGKDSIIIYKNCVFDILMPNAFTPNTDGHNDIFRVPQSNRNRLIRISVFNRFGQTVFESRDINKGWDGRWKNTNLPSGTYIYTLEMMSLDGRTFTHKGTITLIR